MSRKHLSTAAVIWWYSACRACTAKWFAPFRQSQCPRCGSITDLNERRDPPWLNVEGAASSERVEEVVPGSTATDGTEHNSTPKGSQK